MAKVTYNGFGEFHLDYDSEIVDVVKASSSCLICHGPCKHDAVGAHVDDVPMSVDLSDTSAQINGDPILRIAGFDYVSIVRKNRQDYAYVWPLVLEYLRKGHDLDTVFDTLSVINHPITTLPWSALVLTSTSIRRIGVSVNAYGDRQFDTLINRRNAHMSIDSAQVIETSTPIAQIDFSENEKSISLTC